MEKNEVKRRLEGVTLVECVQYFENKATDRDKEIAKMADTKDGEFEVDGAILSEGEDNGAYVMAWTWVSFDGTKFDKEKDK